MPGQEVTHARPRVFEDGTIVYPKRGWEPPPVPEGYRRKTGDLRSPDAWVFLPVLDACTHRTKKINYSACGAAQVTYHCTLFGRVKPPQCQRCTEKR